jgi:hypothetical protein
MKTKVVLLMAGLALFAGASSLASTVALSSAVTGSASPATTEVTFPLQVNAAMEVIGVVPVINSVSGNPASMAANVNVGTTAPFTACGASPTPTCSNDVWVAQWTIQSDSAGVRAVNAFQGGTLRLINNSGSPANFHLRCQVGLMTGACIFSVRAFFLTDPVF